MVTVHAYIEVTDPEKGTLTGKRGARVAGPPDLI